MADPETSGMWCPTYNIMKRWPLPPPPAAESGSERPKFAWHILFKTILNIRNSCFYENLYSQNYRILPVFDKLLGGFWGKRIF